MTEIQKCKRCYIENGAVLSNGYCERCDGIVYGKTSFGFGRGPFRSWNNDD